MCLRADLCNAIEVHAVIYVTEPPRKRHCDDDDYNDAAKTNAGATVDVNTMPSFTLMKGIGIRSKADCLISPE